MTVYLKNLLTLFFRSNIHIMLQNITLSTGIAHQLAGLPGGEWGALARHYPPPLLPSHPHFTPHVLPPAHSQPQHIPPPPPDTGNISDILRFLGFFLEWCPNVRCLSVVCDIQQPNEWLQNYFSWTWMMVKIFKPVLSSDVTSEPITMHAHSTTSPANSRPGSPQDDDISVTASSSPPPDERPGAFTSVRSRKPLQPLPAPSSLFHSALAAQLFLNSPLLPTPPAWLYSQLYGGYDWWLRPPPPQEDPSSSPDREDESSSASGVGKKRPASPEWSEQGVRTRSKSLVTSERRPVDVWRPY